VELVGDARPAGPDAGLHGQLRDRRRARGGPPPAIRAARGDWIDGDPGWYGWVTGHVYRFGLERGAGEVVRDVLGGSPSVDALAREIERART
jgi:hypothetical protein